MISQRSIELLAAKEHLDEAKLQDCKAKANLVAARSKIANTESTRQVKLAALHQAKVEEHNSKTRADEVRSQRDRTEIQLSEQVAAVQLKHEITQLAHSEYEALSVKQDQLQSQKSKLDTSILDLERRLEGLKLQRQDLRHEYDLNSKSLEKSKRSLNDSNIELSSSKSRVSDLQQDVDSQRKKEESEYLRYREAVAAVGNAQRAVDDCQRDLHEAIENEKRMVVFADEAAKGLDHVQAAIEVIKGSETVLRPAVPAPPVLQRMPSELISPVRLQ
eukprot:TRINITY_DN6032_c0_g1_i2.p1 TRINITY_DN6032_c0_g1~~TRINITY_DN6032_c0_g1_i2.p1  ORF type:complete len:275 (+),score=61.38 TRINITY_DN6032_c0_g1_i2:108-932(+)